MEVEGAFGAKEGKGVFCPNSSGWFWEIFRNSFVPQRFPGK
jgi:hypothetical protein